MAAVYGMRPDLITMLTEDDGTELDVDKLHRWSRYLGKVRNAAVACSVLEMFAAIVSIIIVYF